MQSIVQEDPYVQEGKLYVQVLVYFYKVSTKIHMTLLVHLTNYEVGWTKVTLTLNLIPFGYDVV